MSYHDLLAMDDEYHGRRTNPASQQPAPIPDIEVMRRLAGDNWEAYLINRINVAEVTLTQVREALAEYEILRTRFTMRPTFSCARCAQHSLRLWGRLGAQRGIAMAESLSEERWPICLETKDGGGGLVCTLLTGHDGNHRANGVGGVLLEEWPATRKSPVWGRLGGISRERTYS